MKPIKKEDMEVGEFYYLKGGDRRWIIYVDKLLIKEKKHNIRWWWIDVKKMKSKKSPSYFDYVDDSGDCNMGKNNWTGFEFFMLNKKDKEDFKRNLLLQELK